MSVKFADICLITNDVIKLVRFYETLFDVKAEGDKIHSSMNLKGLSLAIYNKSAAINDMEFDFISAGTGLSTIGFNCDEAEIEYERIVALGICEPTKPQLWPWGAKSFRFKDPDGHIIIIRSFSKEE